MAFGISTSMGECSATHGHHEVLALLYSTCGRAGSSRVCACTYDFWQLKASQTTASLELKNVTDVADDIFWLKACRGLNCQKLYAHAPDLPSALPCVRCSAQPCH